MHTIYRDSNRYCNCVSSSENILAENTGFGMSNVGFMVVKIEGSEEE